MSVRGEPEAECPRSLQRLANNFGAFASAVPPMLNLVDFAHRLVGPKPLEFLSSALNRGSNHLVPAWNPYLPKVRPPYGVHRSKDADRV